MLLGKILNGIKKTPLGGFAGFYMNSANCLCRGLDIEHSGAA